MFVKIYTCNMKIVDLVGKKFNRLTVIKLTGESRGGSKIWECICDCGNSAFISTRHLNRKNNIIQSCGCLKKEKDKLIGKDSPYFQGYEGISQMFWTQHILKSAKGTEGVKSRKKLEVSIDKEYLWNLFLEQNAKCALSGLDITLPTKHSDTLFTASVDRKDSGKGYIEGNVQWVHKHVNIMKNMYDETYFINMCKLIAENNNC